MIDFDMGKSLVAVDAIDHLRRGHFKKHIAVIYVKGTLNPLEKRLWNLLTKNAQHRLSEERHEIPVDVLMRAAGIHGNDRRILKPALIKLRKTSIEWIRQDPEGGFAIDSDWAESGFLATVAIVDGMIYYEYSRFLRDQLMNPERFAILHVASGNALKRGKAGTLYEITARFRPNEKTKFPGDTPKWTLDFFRALMGAEAKTYDDFKKLNQKIIQPCIKKVNQETDIKLTPKFHRRGRRVVHLQFKVEDNKLEPKRTQSVDTESETLKSRLIEEYGIGEVEAVRLMEDHPIDYLLEKIAYVDHQIKAGRDIHSLSGYLRKTIKNDYRITSSKSLQKDREAAKKKARIARQAALERKQKEQEELEDRERIALSEAVDAYLDSLPKTDRNRLRSTFEAKMEADPIWSNSWNNRTNNKNLELVIEGVWKHHVRQQMDRSEENSREIETR